MGKSQKKRAFRRHNPVRVPDTHLPHGLDAAESTSSRKDAVIPIIQKIESSEPQERSWACSAVSNLIHNDPSTRRLLQGKNIVGILISKLSDSVEEVVVEAAGALRNLCIDGGYDICAEMYNKSILEPLKGFVPKIAGALNQLVSTPASAPEGTTELVFGLAESVITILWCLSETSNKALNAINQLHLVPFLMGFLEHKGVLPGRVVAAAAQCLYVLTDDNDSAVADLRTNTSYHTVLLTVAQAPYPNATNGTVQGQDITDERLLSVKLLCAGVLKNISPTPYPSGTPAIDVDRTVILPIVAPLLTSVNLVEASARVSELISIENQPSLPNPLLKNTPKSDHRTPTERELEKIEARLRNVQLALEVLTGVCATLPDVEVEGDEEGAKEDGDDSDEDDGDVDMDALDVPLKAQSPITALSATPTSSSHLPTILTPLLTLIQTTPLSFPPLQNSTSAAPLPQTHLPTTSALSAIHIAAFECLNNIFLALAVSLTNKNGINADSDIVRDVQGGVRVWDAIWSALGGVGVEMGPGQERRKEVWEIAAGVLWGLGGIWKGALVPNEGQIAVLIQLSNTTAEEQVKVKCIGTLECLAQHRESIDANRVISDYLLSLLSPASTSAPPPSSASAPSKQTLSPDPLFQAASALIDIFSDESSPYDVNFRSGGYLSQLTASIDVVKRAVKSVDRKKPGGRVLKARGEEVLENLRAFVKYRKALKL